MPGDPDRCYNTSVYLNSQGEITATYRKFICLMSIPNGPQLMESKQTGPGDKAVCADSPMGTWGLRSVMTCAFLPSTSAWSPWVPWR